MQTTLPLNYPHTAKPSIIKSYRHCLSIESCYNKSHTPPPLQHLDVSGPWPANSPAAAATPAQEEEM